jgi:peroxiredoxin
VTGPGDPLPDVPLVTAGGEQVSLTELAREPALIVFLRHLG